MKVAIVHEWLDSIGGAEKVLQQIFSIFPEADLFVIHANSKFLKSVDFLKGKRIKTSFISKLPFADKYFRYYFLIFPFAVEQLDMADYDVVISSSHAICKGVITGPNQLHISYVHSPMRYAWDLQHQYLRESNLEHGFKSWLARWLLHKIRIWDFRTSAGVDHFVANSRFISRRINKAYRRSSDVIYPPVAVTSFDLHLRKENFYLSASRLVPYKRMDLIIKAFALLPHLDLFVIGDGPEMQKLKALATPNVHLLGYQKFEILKDYMQRAKAFVFASEEDFGIAPVEAQACGTPVIAYGKGGATETVIDSVDRKLSTGILFDQQSVESIIKAITTFELDSNSISPVTCRINAERFSNQRFCEEFHAYVYKRWNEFCGNLI